MAKNIGN